MKKIIFLTALSIILSIYTNSIYAISQSHGFTNQDFNRYSIEQVPGTSDFFAAGTDLNALTRHGTTGFFYHCNNIHLLYLDASGNLLNSIEYRPDWPSTGQGLDQYYYSVVDVVAETDAQEDYTGYFWVTVQVKEINNSPSLSQDYIYIARVDPTTGTIITDDYIKCSSSEQYKNTYPTHSLFYDESLYICGYMTQDTEGLDTNSTTNFPYIAASDKIGMILKYNTGTLTITDDTWNTVTTYLDYDNALKMKLSDVHPGEILLTGTANHQPDGIPSSRPSAILVRRYDQNLNLLNSNTMISSSYAYSGIGVVRYGLYGIDITEDNDHVYVLVNEHTFIDDGNKNRPLNKSWGIMQLNPDLSLSYVGNHYIYRERGIDAWAKQFFYEEGGLDELPRFRVIGEQTEYYCEATGNNTPPNTIDPFTGNINPFVAYVELIEDSIGGLSNSVVHWHKIHLSQHTLYWSYLFPTYPDGNLGWKPVPYYSSLLDIRRLYTFALQVDNDPSNDIVMLHYIFTPLPPNTYEHLVKFLRLDNNGDEDICEKQVDDCTDLYSEEIYGPSSLFEDISIEFITNAPISNLNNDPYSGTYDCDNNAVYKPGKTTGIENVRIVDIKLYPNPASTKLNIDFGKAVSEYDIIITDMAGKQVIHQSGSADSGKLTLQLSGLSSGMYIANISADGVISTAKVTVE